MAAQNRQVDYKDMREYMQILEQKGLLMHVTAPVDLEHEVGAILTRSLERKGPAIVFDNIKGYEGKPLVSNIISTVDQLAVAFNCEPDPDTMYAIIVDGHNNRIASLNVETGPCKEVIATGDDIDLYEMPTPYWHELDGGQYIGTAAGVITRDPDTGIINMGTYRAMIVDRNHLTISGQLRNHVMRNDAQGKPTPVAIAIGMDPLLCLASGSPVPVDENGHMEYEAAGAWRGAPTELIRCETNDLMVPAQSEYIIEGEIPANTTHVEGPHGEAGGFYGQNLEASLMTVHCITHRQNPINYGVICLLEEDYPRWLFRSGSFEARIKNESGLTSIRHAYFPEIGGRSWGAAIIAAEINDPEEPLRIIDAAWKITPNRWVIVVDEDCDIRNWNDVTWRIVTNVRWDQDFVKGKAYHPDMGQTQGRRGRNIEYDIDSDIPDPTGINASFKFKFDSLPPINKSSREYMAKIAARWQELGLP